MVKDDTIEQYRISAELNGNGDPASVLRFSVPLLSDSEQREQIINESLFYKVATLDIKTLAEDLGTAKLLEYSCSLSNLIQQRTLSVDNFSLHTLRAKESYVYNGRLHLANVTTRFFDGYPLSLFSVNQDNYHGEAMPVYERRGFVRVTLKGTMGQSVLIKAFELMSSVFRPICLIPTAGPYRWKLSVLPNRAHPTVTIICAETLS